MSPNCEMYSCGSSTLFLDLVRFYTIDSVVVSYQLVLVSGTRTNFLVIRTATVNFGCCSLRRCSLLEKVVTIYALLYMFSICYSL